jgi:DNA mismatch repair ATPase MutS
MNFFGRVFGNGLFLVDFHNVSNLEKWRVSNVASLPRWLESLGEWDALLSFATLHFNQPTFAFAEISEQLNITATALGHPLIPSSHRVVNDFELGKPAGVLLITGANMAGKSTFLRAIGVNYILAINGSPVCAWHWSGPLVELRTGMRTSDSLQENQSYFFAELNRLQSIIQELRNGKPMIILLDEILKGTNSTDKQTGSRELIKQLMVQKALVVIATHDIALGDMEQQYPDKVFNACFEGNIQDDQLTFNYTLNKGVATKANATFLMRKMGIIP